MLESLPITPAKVSSLSVATAHSANTDILSPTKPVVLALPHATRPVDIQLGLLNEYTTQPSHASPTRTTLDSDTAGLFEDDMRVVCTVADRVKWEAHIRAVREAKLRKLGLGSPIMQQPATTYTTKPPGARVPKQTMATMPPTGLHTPAESASSVILPQVEALASKPQPEEPAESIVAQLARLAELRQRHHALSKSVSELRWQNTAAHAHSQSHAGNHMPIQDARALVHERLNSLPPVFVPTGKRHFSAVESIAEEAAQMPPFISQPSVPTTSWADMPVYNPGFYEGCTMPDFSHLPPVQMQPLAQPFTAYESGPHGFVDMYMNGLGSPDQPFLNAAGSIDFNAAHHALPTFDFSLGHASAMSNFILPQRESKAIPIVKPLVPQTSTPTSAETSGQTFDAYDGFDSGSEGDLDAEESRDEQTQDEQENDERVRAFVFPNAKSAPATPSIARTAVFESLDMTRSVSPLKRAHEAFMARETAAGPKGSLASPQRSPARRVFQKSVDVPDAELDQIIRGLTEAQAQSPSSISERGEETSFESEEDISALSSNMLSSPALLSSKRPPAALRRSDGRTIATASSDSRSASAAQQLLLLGHQDAGLGLLLDKMLTTKLAGVSEAVQGIQHGLAALTRDVAASAEQMPLVAQVDELTEALQDARTALDTRDAQVEHLEETVALLHEQIAELECAAAETSVVLPSTGVAEPAVSQDTKAALSEMTERVRVLEGARQGLQVAVRDGTLKRAQLDTQCRDLEEAVQVSRAALLQAEQRAQAAAEQNAALTAQLERTRASEAHLATKHDKLQQEFQEAAVSIAQEQSRWFALEADLRKQVDDAELRAAKGQAMRDKLELETDRLRRVERASLVPTDENILKARVAMLEREREAMAEAHQAELAMRDGRLDRMMEEWQDMARRVAAAEQKVASNNRHSLTVLPDASSSLAERDASVLARTEQLLQSMQALMQQQQTQASAVNPEKAHKAEVAQIKAHAHRLSLTQAAQIADLEQTVADTEIAATRGLRIRDREIGRQRSILEAITSNVEVMHRVSVAHQGGDGKTLLDPKAAMQESTRALRKIRTELEQAAKMPAPRLTGKAVCSTAPVEALADADLAQQHGAVAQLDATACAEQGKQSAIAAAMASLVGSQSPSPAKRWLGAGSR